MNVAIEPFSAELFAEILPLAQRCWQENTQLKARSCAFYGARDFVLEPDIERYRALKDTLIVVTLRGEDTLRGYATGVVYRSLHHKQMLCGGGDSIYLEPAHRAYTGVLVDMLEKRLGQLGALIISWPAHPDSPVYEVLKARGFVGDEVIMEKRPCV